MDTKKKKHLEPDRQIDGQTDRHKDTKTDTHIWVIGSRRLMPIKNCRGLS